MSEPVCRYCGFVGMEVLLSVCYGCMAKAFHDDRYRTAMACMSRFLVWVWMEAEARRDAGTNQRKMKYWRLQVFKRWLERGMFRLEWGR